MLRRRAARAAAATEIQKPDEQWQRELTREQYQVLRRGHTEAPFTGRYVHAKAAGSYHCAGCGNEVFGSDAKFESGTGWPSFYQSASELALELRPDNSLFVHRT